MKNKKILTTIAVVITASILTFTACGKDAEPVTSDAVEETVEPEEPTEPEVSEPEASDNNSTTADQGINEGTAIDRETASEGSSSNENISGTVNGGSDVDMPDDGRANEETTGNDVIYSGEIVTIDGREFKLVGTKGDLSWLRMSESEAQKIVDSYKEPTWTIAELAAMTDEDIETYKAAKRKYEEASAELLARECNGEYAWTDSTTGEGYYNYYDYQAVVDEFQSGVVNVEMASPEDQESFNRLAE